MTKIAMDKGSLDSYASKMGKVSTSIDSLSARVDKVNKALDMDVKAKANIGTSLTKIKSNMTKEKEFYAGAQKGIIRTKEDVFGEDTSLKAKILGAFGVIATVIADLGGLVGKIIGGPTQSGTQPTPVGTTPSNTEPTTGEAAADTKEASQPTTPKSDEEYKKEIDERYQSILKRNNRTTYKGRCGALTNQQLLEKGIVGSKGEVATNYGKDLAKNIASKGTTKTGYKPTTYSSITDLFNESKNRTISNVVVSYNPGGDFGAPAGHAMLIDKIENGKVYFIDNTSYSDTAATGKNNGEYVAQCWTIAEFQKTYFKSSNKCSGIVEMRA